jgi:hypothetical protein
VIIDPSPPVLLGLVVVSWFPLSVVLGLGILLIDTLEWSELKMSGMLVVEVGFVSSLPLDDGGEAEKDLAGESVVAMSRELRTLVSLADEDLEIVRRELDSMATEEFDVPLNGVVAPVPRRVVFAILVVERID